MPKVTTVHAIKRLREDTAYLGKEMKKGQKPPFSSAVAHAAKPLARLVY